MGWRALTATGLIALALGSGTASAQLQLKGADDLQLVVNDVIAACAGATGNIIYIGGASGSAQSAMTSTSPTQHVAPMDRRLNGAACTAHARQLLIGLDAVVVLATDASGADPSSCSDGIGAVDSPLVLTGVPSQFIVCTSDAQCATAGGTTCDTVRGFCSVGGSITGCTSLQGCAPDGTYTFDDGTTDPADDWKDVLAQIYGGQNHTGAPQNIADATEANADGTPICSGGRACKRNPARVDCANPVRGVLMASYSSIIRAPSCTSQACVKLRHAFRRNDLSYTTNTFASVVGLVPIAPFTSLRSTGGPNNPEIADTSAVASPFCNAGTAAMNKGFSDGLDLDPYRRACAAGGAPDRFGLESVCQAFAGPNNSDATCYVAQGTPAIASPVNYPQRDHSAPQGRGTMAGGTADTLAVMQADYLSSNLTRPRCLGVVLPVSVPQPIEGPIWDQNRYQGGGNCTPGVRAFVNPYPAHPMLCPDGAARAASGTCRLPQNTANGRFDCIVDSTGAPGNTPDPRVYNLMPVDNLGHMTTLLDDYTNPSFPNPTPTLRRFARRYFALHMVRPDASTSRPTAPNCQRTDDASQIGCLVKASPCSIGYAVREVADPSPGPFANLALRIAGVQPTVTAIQNFATGATPTYPMSKTFWFNSVNNPGDLVGFAQPNLTDAELALSVCMGLPAPCASDADCSAVPATCDLGTGRCTAGNVSIIDNAMTSHQFLAPPTGARLAACAP